MSSVIDSAPSVPVSASAKTRPLPGWWAESAVAAVGKYPAALGRFLNRLEKTAPLPLRAALRFFSSIWLGITWLVLTALYIGVGSGLAWVRAKFEMTDLQFFDAPPMTALMLLMALTLITVTIRKIPLTLYKMGVWIVHTGILVMVTGCMIYFSHKIEGSVRLFLDQPADSFYDATERALYLTAPDGSNVMAPLPTLPFYYEHVAQDEFPTVATNLPLHTVVPARTLTGLGKAGDGLTVTVTGYLPAAVMTQTGWRDDPTSGEKSPALEVGMAIQGAAPLPRWFVSTVPAQRILETSAIGIEYLHEPSAERVAELTAPIDGPMGIVVHLRNTGETKAFSVTPDQPIVFGNYTLTPRAINEMPMASKGFEGTSSSALTIDVVRKDAGAATRQAKGAATIDVVPANFQRMAVSRFPDRSPDFVTIDGKPKRVQDRVDHNLDVTFIDARKPQFYLVENAAGAITVIARYSDGHVTQSPLDENHTATVEFGAESLTFSLLGRSDHVSPVFGPVIIPEKQRETKVGAQEALARSVIELEMTRGAWKSGPVFVPFAQFLATAEPYGFPPTVVNVPGVGALQLVLSTLRRPLPSTLELTGFEAVKYPGAMNSYADYRSTLQAGGDGRSARTLLAHLNDPARDQGWYYFQSAWDGHDNPGAGERFSVIGVANRPGIGVMELGAILIVAGIGYAFYGKPLLLGIRKRQLIRAVEGRN
jgi:hypothetical protein